MRSKDTSGGARKVQRYDVSPGVYKAFPERTKLPKTTLTDRPGSPDKPCSPEDLRRHFAPGLLDPPDGRDVRQVSHGEEAVPAAVVLVRRRAREAAVAFKGMVLTRKLTFVTSDGYRFRVSKRFCDLINIC